MFKLRLHPPDSPLAVYEAYQLISTGTHGKAEPEPDKVKMVQPETVDMNRFGVVPHYLL